MRAAQREQASGDQDLLREHLPAVGAIAVGGGAGSVLRYELSRAVHPAGNGFPTATLVINLVGALLLGALIVAVIEVWRPHHLVRPLLGTGLLGGFTTFSTFAVETRNLSFGVAALYVATTLIGGLLLAAAGMRAVRRVEPRLHLAVEHEAVDPFDPDLP
jgi:fluoride exporter